MVSSNLLRGDNIRLTRIGRNEMTDLLAWWSDPGFLRDFIAHPAYPWSEEQVARRIESGQSGDDNFLFGIRTNDDNRLIGVLELDGVQWANGNTAISVGIGDPADRGRGYGREAMELALEFAFLELNLYRVFLTVFSYNDPALALYEGLGFTREGVFRQHLERDGQRHDMFLYGLLRPEWLAFTGRQAQ